MDIDVKPIATVLGSVSFMIIGLMLVGAALWQEEVPKYKKLITSVIIGFLLLGMGSFLITAFVGG